MMELVKYVDELNNKVQEYRKEWEPLQEELEKIKAAQLDVNQDKSMSNIRQAAEAEDLKNQESEIYNQLNDLHDRAEKDFEAIGAEYLDAIEDFRSVKSENVDEQVGILLSSGAMQAGDLYKLTEECAENATMLKLIAAEAARQNTPESMSLKAQIDGFMTTQEREEIIKGALFTLCPSLNPGRSLADPCFDYWNNELYEKVKSDVANLESLEVHYIH